MGTKKSGASIRLSFDTERGELNEVDSGAPPSSKQYGFDHHMASANYFPQRKGLH
jgi:hypothetical protein